MSATRTVLQKLKDKAIRAGRALKDSVTTEDLPPYQSKVPARSVKKKKKKKAGVNPFSASRAQKTIREHAKEIDIKKVLR